ncbi:hypothetical protein BpHYR1_044464 [Brachionus plicatilis]|uniref:Uncharacterized protein n=1 Tax=Brachionus plicatilis TaxID=10195 RepID=A0A3M7P4U2_BRAPC|nr:hypothetical protein BpHYR1_044464 [Brachionus plicatilis]
MHVSVKLRSNFGILRAGLAQFLGFFFTGDSSDSKSNLTRRAASRLGRDEPEEQFEEAEFGFLISYLSPCCRLRISFRPMHG